MHDLPGTKPGAFGPFCWRTSMARGAQGAGSRPMLHLLDGPGCSAATVQ